MTSIEWTDKTWNPIVGCSIVSPGCTNCYAMKMAARLEAMGRQEYKGKTRKVNGNAVWSGELGFVETRLVEPLLRRKPTMYFVNSMGDLFHEDCPDEWIDRVFAVMALCPQHTFQVLTKRAERMRQWFTGDRADCVGLAMLTLVDRIPHGHRRVPWPLPNVWLGVSTEDQTRADERIPLLLQTPAAVRFISAEPLLGPIRLDMLNRVPDDRDRAMPGFLTVEKFYIDALKGADGIQWKDGYAERATGGWDCTLNWVIVGGESGSNARPMHVEWADAIVDQCREANVRCFVKQLGTLPMSSDYPMELKSHKGGDPSEWPARLNVRQFPEAHHA